MKILLIGGNRFVGVEILWHLLRAGHDVTVLALDSPPADVRPHIRWVMADRNDQAVLTSVFAHQSFDCVVDNIAYEPSQVERLLASLSGRIGRYVLTSTTDCYPGNMPRGYTEDQTEIREYDFATLSASDRYNYGKRSCEAVLHRCGLPWTVLRPCLVTGPRDNRNGSPGSRMIHWFEESARSHFWVPRVLDGGPVVLCSSDETVFKQILVSDLARAVTHALSHSEMIGQAYNVAGDEVWTNERMVRALAAAAGTDPDIVHVPHDVIEQSGLDYSPVYGTGAGWTLPDNAKLKATGWHPTPAEQWLPLLLEANARPDMRTWYHTRIQEIALARHIQRAQKNRPSLAALPAAIVTRDSAQPALHMPLPGQLGGVANRDWHTRVLRQRKGSVPLGGFYRAFGDAVISRIGLGTWMGDTSRETDQRYVDTQVHAASRGINVFDTAINYRHMQAERCVGAAVRRLSELGIPRAALCIASKGGFVTHDARDPRHPDTYIRESYLQPGLIDEAEMSRHHSISPRFIAHQIDQSLSNLGVATIDIYYLHNPEDELHHLGAELFYARLKQTFFELEKAVAAKKIGCYGLATWDGLRVAGDHSKHLSLEQVIAVASEVAGDMGLPTHHLRAVQIPFNVINHQSLTLATQALEGRMVPALEAIATLGLYSFTSASVLQGSNAPEILRKNREGLSLHTAALRAAYCVPQIGTALAGMRRISSVEEAIGVSAMPLVASFSI